MGRTKLIKFDYTRNVHNVVQYGIDNTEEIKGNWNTQIFKTDQSITLEVGCGHGDYTIGLSTQFKDKNCIGVDVKGSRLYRGAKFANDNGLENAAFLRVRAHEIDKCFNKNEVDEFWITFPDPRPRERDERRRLVHPRYLQLYRDISKDGAIVNLKTDNHNFYLYALQVCQENNLQVIVQTDDLYQSEYLQLCFGIQTEYEKRYLAEGIKINYLKFKL